MKKKTIELVAVFAFGFAAIGAVNLLPSNTEVGETVLSRPLYEEMVASNIEEDPESELEENITVADNSAVSKDEGSKDTVKPQSNSISNSTQSGVKIPSSLEQNVQTPQKAPVTDKAPVVDKTPVEDDSTAEDKSPTDEKLETEETTKPENNNYEDLIVPIIDEEDTLPEITLKPEVTVKPEATDKPENTVKPEATDKPETTPTVSPDNSVEDTEFMSSVEQEIFKIVNQERVANGLPELTYNNTMQKYARIKSKDMGDNNYFSHEDQSGNLITVQMKADGVSYRAWGENIAWMTNRSGLAQQFMTNWMNSSGHRANILSENFSSIGIGVYKIGNKIYATQEFYR